MPVDDGDILKRLVQDARIVQEFSVIKDDQTLTDELKEAVLDRLKKYLEHTGKSAEWAARSMATSPTTLSQVISGSYGADVEPHIRRIDKWLEAQIMRLAAPKPAGFVKTGVAEQIYGIANWVRKTTSIGIVHGPPGCGKTMTLKAIRGEIPGSVFVSIDSSGKSVRSVLETLADGLRMGGLKLNGSQLFRQIVGALKGTERLVMVDEVHKLCGRANDAALHVLRDIHDSTECPMLWAGNGSIADYILKGYRDGHDPLCQIYSRVAWWLNLTEIAEGGGDGGHSRLYTIEDIRRVFAASKVRLTSDAHGYLLSLANDPGMGCLRIARRLVEMAEVASKGNPVDAEFLRRIQRERLGFTMFRRVEETLRTPCAAAG
ncbi:MAG TPA: AAA family ATPase [Phycisphaerae bacterium]|nr:AAA family ATPase [Phycisphaerae bacterium]